MKSKIHSYLCYLTALSADTFKPKMTYTKFWFSRLLDLGLLLILKKCEKGAKGDAKEVRLG